MNIEFHKISDFEKGTLLNLLKDAYSFDEQFETCFIENWEDCDSFFYENINIGDKYCFISSLNNKPVGFICWDPRTLPEFVEIGHNCVAQEYKGLGIGKTQLREALRRISDYGVKKITVTTNETLKPARCNYESAGFIRIRSRKNESESRFSGDYIDYELLL